MSHFGSTEFLIEVRKGNVVGHAMVHKFGANLFVPNGSWAFVNLLGFTAWPQSTGTTVRVKAGNAADTAAGAGAQEVTVVGLQEGTLLETSETIATNGGSASLSTTTVFHRVYRVYVSAVGTYEGNNTGDIVIENTAGTQDLLKITAGDGQSLFAGYSIPAGKTAYFLGIHNTVDTGKAVDIRVMTRRDLDDVTSPFAPKRQRLFFAGLDAPYSYVAEGPDFSLAEKADIWVEGRGAGGTASVSSHFEILLVDD